MSNEKLEIFISWGKEPADQIANLLRKLISKIFPEEVSVFVSDSPNHGIESGEDFRISLKSKLQKSDFGILILTEYNYGRPWLMYEAGALSKAEHARVVPIVFSEVERKMESPINSFNHLKNTFDDFLKLMITIKKRYHNSTEINSEQNLKTNLSNYWNNFDKNYKIIMNSFAEVKIPEDSGLVSYTARTREDYLTELLDRIENIKTRIIFFGGISTELRKSESILKLAKWVIAKNEEEKKLFICYENEQLSTERAMEAGEPKSKKTTELEAMKSELLEDISDKFKRNVYFIELNTKLSSYIIVDEKNITFSPLYLERRSSDTTSFADPNRETLSHMIAVLSKNSNVITKDEKALIEELENVKHEIGEKNEK